MANFHQTSQGVAVRYYLKAARAMGLLGKRERNFTNVFTDKKANNLSPFSHQRIQMEQTEKEIQKYLFSLANHVKNKTV